MRLSEPGEHDANGASRLIEIARTLDARPELGANGRPVETAECRIVIALIDGLPDLVE